MFDQDSQMNPFPDCRCLFAKVNFINGKRIHRLTIGQCSTSLDANPRMVEMLTFRYIRGQSHLLRNPAGQP